MVTRSNRRRDFYEYKGQYFKDGYLHKAMRMNLIQADNVNPTLDELARFEGKPQEDDGTGTVACSRN